MRRFALTLAVALTLVVAQAAHAKDTWTSVRSQNFHLVGNASEKDIRQVAVRLEQFRHVFSRLFKGVRVTDSVPTTVIVFKNADAYKPFNPRQSAGYFQPGEEVNYITLTAESRSAADNPFAVIFHEYLHLLINNNVSPNTPAWLNEGLAEFYSTLEVQKGEKAADIGKPIADHVFYLRQQKLLPLRTLFAVDHSSPHYNEQSKRGVFYAQSWALVHYLMLGKERKRQPQLNRYLDLVGRGTSQQESFQTAFGADIEAIEKELRDYIGRNTYPYVTFDLDQKLELDATMQSTQLTEGEALAYLGDLALHSPYLREQAETNLQKALALDPTNTMAQASMGMLRMRQGRFNEAKEHLRRAVAADARNHLAHYYYAYTLSREGMDATGLVSRYSPQTATEMRAALRKAIELKPEFADSYHLLAFVNLIAGEQLDESIALLKRGLALAPARQEFTLMLAQLHLRKEEFDAARKLVEPLARNAPDPNLRRSAQSILDSITRYQEQVARFKKMQEEGRADAGGDDGDDDAASEDGQPPRLKRRGALDDSSAVGMTPEEAFASALNEALRKPQSGETRVRGRLTRIECGAKGVVFHVREGERVLRLASRDFESIQLTAFTQEAGGQIGCGPRKPESHVVITYRADAKTKDAGALVAVEFVPAAFALKQ